MARLRNIKSGAIVVVADEKVERLGSEWEAAADETQKERKARSKKTDEK